MVAPALAPNLDGACSTPGVLTALAVAITLFCHSGKTFVVAIAQMSFSISVLAINSNDLNQNVV
ncbi:MAG: hypothetical protein F6J89_01550 [Symploca sp. SIO1C4]|uniref:Uncharacterized protein n=1 Tax=Symploca sp. SIO1C4 TaxID=2607765 RepID=A0A6B3N8B2_9CYAN|nr:hypothetical protein [Symploca sp. SIO1C4]